jgi:hypothetical protein
MEEEIFNQRLNLKYLRLSFAVHAKVKEFYGVNMEKVIFDLKLPEGTQCIGMNAIDNICLTAAFHVPERGLEIYVLSPHNGKIIKCDILDREES